MTVQRGGLSKDGGRVRSLVGVDSCGTREPSLRSSDGGRNAIVTQLVDQKIAVMDGDGTQASSRGVAAHW
jgi:hypothetical protein